MMHQKGGRPALWTRFLEKAQFAMVAAIEIHNKPLFSYREETFSILAVNAWELLLKAKILKENNNNPKSIREYEPKTTRTGRPGKKLRPKLNRSGNPMTLSLSKCVAELGKKTETALDVTVQNNLAALVEIRDNSSHFLHTSPDLVKKTLEISAANVSNFVTLVKRWFKRDLTNSFSLVMPLSFVGVASQLDAVAVTADERRLLSFLQSVSAAKSQDEELHVSMRLEVKVLRTPNVSGVPITITNNDPNAIKVTITEEDVRQKFPWDFNELCKRCKKAFPNFKQDKRFHAALRLLAKQPNLIHERLLDPNNPRSPKKKYYNPNIIKDLEIFI